MNPKVDITGVVLESKSLILRPFEAKDLKDFNEYAKVPGVGEMAGWVHHQSMEESKAILDMFIDGRKTFAITDKASRKVIGSLGIEEYDEALAGEKYDHLKCREIGYVLGKDYWGKAYMPQAADRLLQYCFEELRLDAVFCGYFKQNTRSKRVGEKLGFRYLCEHSYTTRYGTVEDSVLTVLHREEWFRKY